MGLQNHLNTPSVEGSSKYQSINPSSMVDIKAQICLSYHYENLKNVCKGV
jgi:hypothetical protein